MMAEQVKPDTFDPPHHKLKTNTQTKLDALLKEYETQFCKGWDIHQDNPINKDDYQHW